MQNRDQLSIPLLTSFGSARAFFLDWFSWCEDAQEILFVAHVDKGGSCVHLAQYDGDQFAVDLPLKAIISDAIEHRSSGLLIAHNHPSGDPRPSNSDCQSTRRLAAIAQVLDCRIVDHLVFAGNECISFRQIGLL